MAPVSRLAVIPPRPSFDPSSYKPFDNEVDRTIDQILSEEASLESSRDEDWPVSLGGGNLNQEIEESRFFSKGAVPNGVKSKHRNKHVARRSITVVDLVSDDEESLAQSDTNHQEIEANDPDSDPDVGNEIDNESPINHQLKNGDVSDMYDPLNAGGNEALEPNITDDLVTAEEDVIFASVEPSQRDHLLHYLVSHPFMQHGVQPVQRSARRHFVDAMRKEAVSVGMCGPAINQLIEYVRKLYLEELGVQFQLPSGQPDDVPFGEEIDDDPLEKSRERKSSKRRRDDTEHRETKKSKRRKERKRSSHRNSTSSPQSALERDISRTVQSPLDNPLLHEIQNHDAGPAGVNDEQALETLTREHAHSKEFEDMGHASHGVELETGEDETTIKKHARTPTMGLRGHSSALEEDTHDEKSFGQQSDETLERSDSTTVVRNPHSEPDFPPTRNARASAQQDQVESEKQDAAEVFPARPTQPHGTKIKRTYTNKTSKHKTAAGPDSKPSSTRSRANQTGSQDKKQQDTRASKTSTFIDASIYAVQQSPPETAKETPAEQTEEKSKKHLNYKRKEKKKRKKRQSFLDTISSEHQEDHQAQNLPSTLAESAIPVSITDIPEIRTPQKSPSKFKLPALSPNPAEWDSDF